MIANYPINFISDSGGGGGGGTTFPTFTYSEDEFSCDLTYAQTYAVMMSEGVGEDSSIPCIIANITWAVAFYFPNDEAIQEIFEEMPETVNYGFFVAYDNMPVLYYADDGNIYRPHKDGNIY